MVHSCIHWEVIIDDDDDDDDDDDIDCDDDYDDDDRGDRQSDQAENCCVRRGGDQRWLMRRTALSTRCDQEF